MYFYYNIRKKLKWFLFNAGIVAIVQPFYHCRKRNDQEYLKQHKEETQDFCFQYPLLCVPE